MNDPTPLDPEQLRCWRLILGKDSQDALGGMCGGGVQLSADQLLMDEALAAIYDETEQAADSKQRQAGLGGSTPRLAKWLGDIRTYFTEDVVTVIQQDAMDAKECSSFCSSRRCVAILELREWASNASSASARWQLTSIRNMQGVATAGRDAL